MKSFPIKSFSILAIIICIFACDRLSAPGGTDRNCAEGIGPKRTLAEAELFASDLLQQFDTKASPHRKIHERICVKRPVTKGENQDDTDTLMYLFNLADDGFIIVSADNRDYPLVAYVEKGQIDQSLKTSVPPFLVKCLKHIPAVSRFGRHVRCSDTKPLFWTRALSRY